ncbi:hypothetical protein [Caldithrix abyssi]
MKSAIIILLSVLFAFGQEITIDWKYHNVGRVRQLITNKGPLWPAGYPVRDMINCEYPPGSFEEHIGEAGIWIGAITPQGDTLVSVTTSWNPWNSHFEFWPVSSNPWDTIWVAARNDTLDIPYWPNYVGLADQDFICRYNDYNPVSMKDSWHRPLYVDVIQVSHAWASPQPLNEIILFDFYIIPARFDLKRAFITYWVDPNVGFRFSDIQQFLRDDMSWYFYDQRMGVGVDGRGGGDGEAFSPIGFKIIPPKGYDPDQLKWSFQWNASTNPPGLTPATDAEKYRLLMDTDIIMDNQQIPSGSHFVMSFGPFDLAVGDTLFFRIAEILGEGVEGVLNTAHKVDLLAARDFQLPAPPPRPPFRFVTDNHKVTLIWKPTPENNPELYMDPNRTDGEPQPFEGYRVYKSTQSIQGPWKLLAEYDIPDNDYGNNIGLQYEYVDEGLLNNVEYYYSVTAFSKEDRTLNWPSLESSINQNAKVVVPGTAPPPTVGQVAVVPNPYRGDIDYNAYNPPWEKPEGRRSFWMEQDRRIQFINLPKDCLIKIYTLSGDLVNTIEHHGGATGQGYHDWNLTSSVGQAVASGIYMFSVKDLNNGNIQVGKFVIIK